MWRKRFSKWLQVLVFDGCHFNKKNTLKPFVLNTSESKMEMVVIMRSDKDLH